MPYAYVFNELLIGEHEKLIEAGLQPQLGGIRLEEQIVQIVLDHPRLRDNVSTQLLEILEQLWEARRRKDGRSLRGCRASEGRKPTFLSLPRFQF